jgi:hypothetical protein
VSLFLAPETLPFGVALLVMLGLAALETIGLVSSFSPSEWIDHSLGPTPEAGVEGVLGWLHVGRVPTLALLILFLASFAVIGYALQIFAKGLFGVYVPALIAGVAASVGGVSTVRVVGGWLGQIMPRDETSIVSESEFIGRVATVTAASSRESLASSARLKDAYGRSHYILAEPDLPDLELSDGMEVLVVKKVGPVFRVIPNPHPKLM